METSVKRTILVSYERFSSEHRDLVTLLAAKLALVGLTQTLAKEGFGDNILVNAIAPIGASIPHPHMFEAQVFHSCQSHDCDCHDA